MATPSNELADTPEGTVEAKTRDGRRPRCNAGAEVGVPRKGDGVRCGTPRGAALYAGRGPAAARSGDVARFNGELATSAEIRARTKLEVTAR